MCKVSIIVPIYNVEKYLDRCIVSLLHQTLEEIEIILVNDGSTDQSQIIIDKYSHQDARIRSFTKENGGLSDARNFAFDKCKGEYIGFVDSDDFVDEIMYERLYEKAIRSSSQIVECNLKHTYETFEDTEIGVEYRKKDEMLIYGRSVVWNKIYQKDWLLQTKIKFPKDLIYEDVQFYVQLIPHISSYEYIKEPLIHYVQRSTSLNNFSTLKTLDIMKVLENILDYYITNQFYQEYESALEMFFIRILLCSSFARMSKIPNKMDRKTALKQNRELLERVFPNWMQNSYLKNEPGLRGLYMKTNYSIIYKLYSLLFPIYHKFKIKNKK